jgi:hypothetical protein
MKGQLFIVLFAALIATGCGKKPTEVAPPDAGAPPKAAKLRVVAPGDAPADLKQSYVQLSIIKDKDVKNPVVGRMLLDDGAVALSSPTPSAHLLVDIDTLDTGVPIRNERVRNIFFETSNVGWDTVDVTIPVLPVAVVTALQGQRHVEQAKLDATLKVHGRKVIVDAGAGEDLGLRAGGQRCHLMHGIDGRWSLFTGAALGLPRRCPGPSCSGDAGLRRERRR